MRPIQEELKGTNTVHHFRPRPLALVVAAFGASQLFIAMPVGAQSSEASTGRPATVRSTPTARPATQPSTPPPATPRLACTSVTSAPPTSVALGKSRVIQLSAPAVRLIGSGRPSSWIGQPVDIEDRPPNARGRGQAASQGSAAGSDGVADTEITLLSPTELLVLGRRPGSSNVIVQDREGRCVVRDIFVTIDPDTLQGKLGELMPEERGVKVSGADNALVLTGTVSDSVKLDQVMSLATSYGDGKKVVNLLRVTAPQQVMLEVKIAEVSKGLLDHFGLDFTRALSSGDRTSLISGIIGGAPGVFGRFSPGAGGAFSGSAAAAVSSPSAAAAVGINGTTRGASLFGIDAENRDGIVRILAEPNIMAISGQSASFLSGGKIFIPVAQSRDGAATTITLEEKEFGVGLKFTPTVLDGRINLKVTSEVSELSQSGTPFTTVNGATAVLPSMTTRRVDTTVQLGDGQSFAVAGLIKNNVTEAVNKFPGLGEAPVVGALFRSTEFQNDKTELMFVVTPRLVRPSSGPITLPTDNHVPPSRADVILRGAGEGSMPPAQRPPVTPAPIAPAPAGPVMPVSPAVNPPSRPPAPVSEIANPGVAVALAAPRSSMPQAQSLQPLEPPHVLSHLALQEQPHFE